MTVATTDHDWQHETDRLYLSRLSPGPLLLRVGTAAGVVAADGPVAFTLTPEFNGAETYTADATLVPFDGIPEYVVALPSSATSIPGPYTARWDYTVDEVEMYDERPILVGGTAPAYDSLPLGMKAIVEAVWLRIADQFDSPMGGPHLQVYVQSKFGRNRIAQLLPKALGRLNTISQPHMTYSVDGTFPFAAWGSLLELALWIETVKHLRRSYLEQPNEVGVNVAYLDRKHYSDRWAAILADEEPDFRRMLDHFKMSHMGLGQASVLVAGGVYPVVSIGGVGFGEMAAPRGIYLTRL